MASDEKEDPHFNYDSDGEPPTDHPGDNLTIIQPRKVTKTIIETGEGLGKPGRPFIVLIEIEGFFAEVGSEQSEEPQPDQKPKGKKRAGYNENRKRFKDDQVKKGKVFWPQT